MTGAIVLQGGGEFAPECTDMDRTALARAPAGPVVVTALAGAPGRETRTADGNGVAYLGALGADAVAAPDARDDEPAAVAAIDAAALLFLPGGSPARLLETISRPALRAAVMRLLARDGVLVGASAGAMVLAGVTLLPERGGRPRTAPGLGLVPGTVVIPHYRGDDSWWRAVPDRDALVGLGLPECSGVMVDGDVWSPLGARSPMLITMDGSSPLRSPSTAPQRGYFA
jgi:cyanophycinase-like exopeptidase